MRPLVIIFVTPTTSTVKPLTTPWRTARRAWERPWIDRTTALRRPLAASDLGGRRLAGSMGHPRAGTRGPILRRARNPQAKKTRAGALTKRDEGRHDVRAPIIVGLEECIHDDRCLFFARRPCRWRAAHSLPGVRASRRAPGF